MPKLPQLFEQNSQWSEQVRRGDPAFFEKLSQQQSPDYLWIGCSDSRVPANQIVGMLPGELFVHRNVANVVVHTDLNCLSTIQFAVDVLKVRHIITCGHYGCGGVKAALTGQRLGLVDNWIAHVRDVREKHKLLLAQTPEEQRWERLCQLNVIEQAVNVCQTNVVQDAWAKGQELTVHGWIYSLRDGLLNDLGLCVSAPEALDSIYQQALTQLSS
ncbi:MAG: carbonate dehydratase [Anaerolineales bacterium]